MSSSVVKSTISSRFVSCSSILVSIHSRDFLCLSILSCKQEDLRSWYPELANNVRITLVEALPSVLPSFSKQLIEYTESTFKEAKIDILTKTMVKEIKEKSVILQKPDKSIVEVPCGMVVWAAVSGPYNSTSSSELSTDLFLRCFVLHRVTLVARSLVT